MRRRDENRRLWRALAVLLVLGAPAAIVQACGTDGGAAGGGDAGADAAADHASPSPDSGADGLAASDATADATSDAPLPPPPCAVDTKVYDAGMDGDAWVDPSCTYTRACGITPDLVLSGCQVLAVSSFPDAAPIVIDCWVVADSCGADVYVPDANVTIACAQCLGGD